MENGDIYTISIPILGQLQVGKSSLFSRLVHGKIREELLKAPRLNREYLSVHGIETPQGIRFIEKKDGSVVKLVFSDDPECRISSESIETYLKGASAVLLVFDVTDSDSAMELPGVVGKIQKLNGLDTFLHSWLIGNKIDQREVFYGSPVDESVSNEKGKELALKLGCVDYVELSARTGEGVEALIQSIMEFFQ
ncbi:MAG: hypothetical protein ACTSRU_03570 [Candidatus Hodarchaeales archaeon]